MKRAFLVAGLAWGDEGKGATVDFLTWKYNAELVVRYNGGSQAGHNVVTPDGRWHTFQQFGAGTFHPGVRTHLSQFMLINPMNMMREEEHLASLKIYDAWRRTTVDEKALIITPFHRELNRELTPAGSNSCGHGVGVCRQFHLEYGDQALFAGDLLDETKVRKKLKFLQDWCDVELFRLRNVRPTTFSSEVIDQCWQWYRDWREMVHIVPSDYLKRASWDTIIFEGAQGVLLDETHGEENFNTWTDTTFNNANQLLDEAGFNGERTRVGVIRSYYTRHGAGPFPTEDPAINFPEPHNEDTGFQGKFRRGRFDYELFDKAVNILGGIDILAINHLDQRLLHQSQTEWPTIIGIGPTYRDRDLV